MVIANFDKGSTYKDVFRIYQYDYGQILRIQGLNLPTAVEVHFSLQNTGGEATTRIGVTKDGVTDAVIPDSLLENGDIAQDYKIYAFIYLRNETSGQTEYKITMHVTSRRNIISLHTRDRILGCLEVWAPKDSGKRSPKRMQKQLSKGRRYRNRLLTDSKRKENTYGNQSKTLTGLILLQKKQKETAYGHTYYQSRT